MLRTRPTLVVMAVTAIILAACGAGQDAGGDSPTTIASGADAQTPTDSAEVITEEEAAEQAQDIVDDLTESLEEQQEAVGGGGATLTVGATTWTFDSVLCAFGPDEIGQAGAEFVLSSLQDGLQLYVSIDSFGHSVSLDDVTDFENPSVALSAEKFTAALNGAPEEFVDVNGKEVASTALFVDGTTDDPEPIEGTLAATCP